MIRKGKYCVIYTEDHCRGIWWGDTRRQVEQFIAGRHFSRWAVYRQYLNGKNFHNATDETFLVAHDDVYWHNRGFATGWTDNGRGGNE